MVGQLGGWGVVEEGWRKGPWTAEEDKLLVEYVRLHGEGRWNSVARITGLKRNGKSCRLRWVNYLRPDLKRGQITPNEERIIIELHARWGNRWSTIARSLPGRTDNEIKNYWRTHFKNKAGKTCRSSVENAKSRLLRRQQLHQHQQRQQQQQQQQEQRQLAAQPSPVDIRTILSFLEETDHRVPYMPHAVRPESLVACPGNWEHQQGPLCSIFGNHCKNSASFPEDFNEDVLWDGLLWNMDEFHAKNGGTHANGRASLQNMVAPFC